LPLLDRIDLDVLSWESVVQYIGDHDPVSGRDQSQFLDNCLRFNRPRRAGPRPVRV
jgi:hypothetical protein